MEAPFLMSEDMGASNDYLNTFAEQLHIMVRQFEELIVVENAGRKELTEFGQFIREFVIVAMQELGNVMVLVKETMLEFGGSADAAKKLIYLFFYYQKQHFL